MSHADKADKLLIKPTAGARPASPCTPGRNIRKAHTSGLTPQESQVSTDDTTLATAPDGPTNRLSQTPEQRQVCRGVRECASRCRTAPSDENSKYSRTAGG
jgi:hypothetical protein